MCHMETDILIPGAIEVYSRFLHPFHCRIDGGTTLDSLADALCSTGGLGTQMWELVTENTDGKGSRHRENYRQELLHHVADFMFPPHGQPGCHYLRWSDKLINVVFGKRLNSRDSKGKPDAWRLSADASVELFISPYGVGLLSIGLQWIPDTPVSLDAIQEFNYRLAQQRASMLHQLGRPHIKEHTPQRPANIPQEQWESIEPAPAADAGIEERLGRGGGWFNLVELKSWALAPLRGAIVFEPRR